MGTKPQKIAVYQSEDSYVVFEYVLVSSLSMAAKQLIENQLVFQIYRDPLGNFIIVDLDDNRYPALP